MDTHDLHMMSANNAVMSITGLENKTEYQVMMLEQANRFLEVSFKMYRLKMERYIATEFPDEPIGGNHEKAPR